MEILTITLFIAAIALFVVERITTIDIKSSRELTITQILINSASLWAIYTDTTINNTQPMAIMLMTVGLLFFLTLPRLYYEWMEWGDKE